MTPTCESSFQYNATVSGGSNPPYGSYEWTFEAVPSQAGAVLPPNSLNPTGWVSVDPGAVLYRASLHFTDPRTDLLCEANATAEGVPYDPLHVDLALEAHTEMCPATDAVTYTAVPSGGLPPYGYHWSTHLNCESVASCSVGAPDKLCEDKSVEVILTDSSGLCAPTVSETETYSKVTYVKATDLP